MRTSKSKALLGLGLTLSVFAAVETGCAQVKERMEATQSGAEMQKSGIMQQGDYVRVRALGHSVSQTHMISDADLSWTLTLLRGAKNSIARARALTVLSEIRPMSGAQRAKIAPAVAPYLNSSDQLDKVGAQMVERAMQATRS